ncbi:Uncharacterised protein [Escherichia coli]|nr:hypothetical protein BvCmsF63A_01823 [Escherichia coli]GDV15116.1 hypothetical protein BvCmsSINP049_03488 [Escherichia coli]SQK06870.1 Uncharacterised protein [Escherichia coli]SVF09633.1 Uncharacterised protein [Escherichia coli]
MWKTTGEKVIVAYVNGNAKYSRIEMSGQHARLIRE